MRMVALMVLLAGVAVPLTGAATATARAETVQVPGGGGATLSARLFRPAGAPTAPAVVALHGCAGPVPSRDRQWAEALNAAGHIVLFPDSFRSRGLGPQCRVTGGRVATAGGLRRLDALAAAAWLAAQPGTPPGGIAVIGWSDGGSTALAAAERRPDVPAGLLRGFIALYPGCRRSGLATYGPPVAPILLLIGADDEWTPAAPCEALARRVGERITLVTYPGAFHDFDAPFPVRVLRNIPRSQNPDGTVHAGQDQAAQADALARVPAFLRALPPAP